MINNLIFPVKGANMKKSNDIEIVSSEDIETISLYDDNYPVKLLSNGLNNVLNLANIAVEKVYKSVSKHASDMAQIPRALTKDFKLVLDVTDDVKKKIATGELKLTVENGGKTYAQFRNGSRYGKKIPVKKEEFCQGIDPVQMANAMQMRAIQSQLENMTEQLSLIDSSARQILQGQQNDRIAMYYSGLSLYLEAKNISDDVMKKQLIAQALRALNEATFQLNLNLKSEIEYLKRKEFKKHKKNSVELIDEKINNINQSFKYINQASLLRAGIYCELGELTAMTSVLNEYSKFIKERIAGNAELLVECDVADTGLPKSGWKARANLHLDMDDISRKIEQKDKVLYLTMEEKDND